MENPIKIHDLGGPPLFLETTIRWRAIRFHDYRKVDRLKMDFSSRMCLVLLMATRNPARVFHRLDGAKTLVNNGINYLLPG